MKKKLLITALIVSVLACIFAISVSAAATNEFGTPEIVKGMDEKSVFGADGKADTFTTRIVLFDGEEYHTYPSYYVFTNDVHTTYNFKQLNELTGKSYAKKSAIRVEVPHNVQKVTGDIFNSYNDLKYVLFPDTLKEISGNMFYTSHGLEWVNVPRDCTLIGAYAFYGCAALTTIDMSGAKSLKRTEANQFFNCPKLEELIFPEGFEYFGGAGGGGSNYQNGLGSLKKLYLPDSVTYMGTIAEMKSIGTFRIPQGVTTIKAGQFSYCTGLKKVIVHKGITSFAQNAFDMTFYIDEFVYTGGENDPAVAPLKSYRKQYPDGVPTFTFGNHCEYYYDGVHNIQDVEGNLCSGVCQRCQMVAIKENPIHASTWIFNGGEEISYKAEFSAEFVCQHCQTVEKEESIGAMFTTKGYSFEDDGKGIYQNFKFDKEAIQKYADISGKNVSFGLVAGIAIDASGAPLEYSQETSEVVAKEKTVVAVFDTDTQFTQLQIKIAGVDRTASVYCGAFVCADTSITYMMGTSEGASAEKYDFVIE